MDLRIQWRKGVRAMRRLGDLEAEIMDRFRTWNRPATVRDVVDDISSDRGRASRPAQGPAERRTAGEDMNSAPVLVGCTAVVGFVALP
jgi:hypothetical protein